jgi:hypothetical protein
MMLMPIVGQVVELGGRNPSVEMLTTCVSTG